MDDAPLPSWPASALPQAALVLSLLPACMGTDVPQEKHGSLEELDRLMADAEPVKATQVEGAQPLETDAFALADPASVKVQATTPTPASTSHQDPYIRFGERIIVHGYVLDEDKRPVPDTLVEIWQANACGRYVHNVDQHPAPLDPNFTGAGRTITDKKGYYRFITVKPGAYPWGNHHNAWRPNHIHFSVFGHSFLSRLVTQMYFPGDPLFPFDPIFNSVLDPKARERMICRFDLESTNPEYALGYIFDIVLRGPAATPPDVH